VLNEFYIGGRVIWGREELKLGVIGDVRYDETDKPCGRDHLEAQRVGM
jgi:hypothetical protein